MDGDIPRVAAPMSGYDAVLQDPIGFKAITQNTKHAGAGRYVCHAVTKWWFTDVFAFVKMMVKDPVHSIYYTSTILVALLHLLFLWLAFSYAKAHEKFSFKKFFPIALIASVFIQFNGFYSCIGIIDRSIDYVLFYGLPVILLLLYLLPFYKSHVLKDYVIKKWQQILLFVFAPVLAFSGPLIQPIVFIAFLLYMGGTFIKNPFFRIESNNKILGQFLFLVICCAYAFLVSQYNSESSIYKPLSERYHLLLLGLERIFTIKNVWPIVLIALLGNFLLIRFKKLGDFKNVKSVGYFILFFSLIYVALLPLGGFRSYREFIIRYDTFLPVTLSALFLLLYTTRVIYSHINGNGFIIYTVVILAFSFYLFNGDKHTEREANFCEQGQLYEMMASKEKVIRKKYQCNVLIWDVNSIYDQANMEAVNTMLRRWDIIQPNQRVEFYEAPSE